MVSTLYSGEAQVELNGILHWYKVAGVRHSTTPIVIIHGGPGGNVFNFERTIGPKLEDFATIIYYEQRGCGRSLRPKDPTAYSIPLLISDLDLLRQKLRLAKIIPLGFSFGGELALEYTLASPQQVEKLILQAPSMGQSERTACVQLYGFQSVAQGAMAHKIQEIISGADSLEERLERVWKIVDTETVDRFLFHNRDVARMNRRLWQESGLTNTGEMHKVLAKQPVATPLLERIHAVQVPTLLMIGLYDRNIGIETTRDVTSLIPQARLALFDYSAHFPEMEEPEKYTQTVHRFLFG
jgi:proline iminopeptidase